MVRVVVLSTQVIPVIASRRIKDCVSKVGIHI